MALHGASLFGIGSIASPFEAVGTRWTRQSITIAGTALGLKLIKFTYSETSSYRFRGRSLESEAGSSQGVGIAKGWSGREIDAMRGWSAAAVITTESAILKERL